MASWLTSTAAAPLDCLGAADDTANGYPRICVHDGPGRHTATPGSVLHRSGPSKLNTTDYRLYWDATLPAAIAATRQLEREQFSRPTGYTRAQVVAALNAITPWAAYTSETLVARVMGDSQTRALGRTAAMAQLAAMAEQPLAYIASGDLVADTPTQAYWNEYLADVAGLADVAWGGTRIPLYGVPGNHDVATTGALWDANLARQAAIHGLSRNYSFVAGPVRFVVLNFTDGSLAHRVEQRDWLADVLARAPEPWVIPCWHVRTYPADNLTAGADWNSKEWSLSAVSRIEAAGKTKCPCVLHAHTHLYERTHPMTLGVRDDAAGITYITAPAFSATMAFAANLTRVTTITNADTGEERTDVADAANFSAFVASPAEYGYLDVRASTTTLTVEYRSLADPATVLDTVTFTKP